MAAAAGGGRRRTQSNTTEDNALNMIAREAEAKLAAKRAARAEARSIRMKELERMQKEADEKMDKEYRRSLMNEEAIKKRIQSHLTTSPPVPEVEVNGPVATESQLKALQDNVQDLEMKYRSTMVNIAQLDNERQALSYQVDCLKERLEDEEETAENLRAEVAQRSKECNKLSYENKKNLEEIERLQLMLSERDRILEEHNINLEEELMGITSTDGMSPRTNESVNMNESVEIEHSGGSSGGLKSRGSSRRSSGPDDKETLLEQIRSLKEEVSELRRENDTESSRVRDLTMEEMRTASWDQREAGQAQVNEFEGSTFVDVSGEAADVEPEPAGGYVVNNNEKNEDFEVIDHNLQAPGGLPNFEDKSYEGVSTTSMATESLDSLDVTESMDSEVPVEISVGPGLEPEDLVVTLEDHASLEVPTSGNDTPKDDSTKEYPDYDIVEDTDLKYSSDVEEGARVRSRYFSLPPDEDDGFETPPESEDELRKLSSGDTIQVEHVTTSTENISITTGAGEVRKEEGPESELVESAGIDNSVTSTSLLSEPQKETNLHEGSKPGSDEVQDAMGEESPITPPDVAKAEDVTVLVNSGNQDFEEKEGLEDQEKTVDEGSGAFTEAVDPQLTVVESSEQVSASTDALDSGEQNHVTSVQESDSESGSRQDREEEDNSKVESDIVPQDTSCASNTLHDAPQEIGKEGEAGELKSADTHSDVEETKTEGSEIILDNQPQNGNTDMLLNKETVVDDQEDQSPILSGKEEHESSEVRVASDVNTGEGVSGVEENICKEGEEDSSVEKVGEVLQAEEKAVGDENNTVASKENIESAVAPVDGPDVTVTVSSVTDQESVKVEEEKKAEGESSPMPVPKKRKKKKGKKKAGKGDISEQRETGKPQEGCLESENTEEKSPLEPQSDRIPSVSLEGSDDSQLEDGTVTPFEEEGAGKAGGSDENSNSTVAPVDATSGQEPGVRVRHGSELDPKNDEDSDQSGNEGGLKKRKSRKSKKEQKKEGCKNQ